jgi:hypothetical protein
MTTVGMTVGANGVIQNKHALFAGLSEPEGPEGPVGPGGPGALGGPGVNDRVVFGRSVNPISTNRPTTLQPAPNGFSYLPTVLICNSTREPTGLYTF